MRLLPTSAVCMLSVTVLRLLWVVIIIWFEFGLFHLPLPHCQWPVNSHSQSDSGLQPLHVLLVADPQILGENSYPDRPRYINVLTRFIVHLTMKRSWRLARKTHPDAIIFLGDMLDEGRMDMSAEKYERYYGMFRAIFSNPASTPTYYIPGNHDVGLGSSTSFSNDARTRYTDHFGPLNQHISIGNHTIVMIDAIGLIEEDYHRCGRRVSYDKWYGTPGGTIEFVKNFSTVERTEPVILLSHVPLWRPDSSSCGPLRERGTVRQGLGHGYQNVLGKETTAFLLQSIKPAVIFSADDHDYCEYIHPSRDTHSGLPTPVREVTVKSFSMAMGIYQPGFQLLTLDSEAKTHADVPCSLPSPLHTYLTVYIPLAVLSLLVLCISHIFHKPRHSLPLPQDWEYKPLPPKVEAPLNGRRVVTKRRRRRSWSEHDVFNGEKGYDSDSDELWSPSPSPLLRRSPPLLTPAWSPTGRWMGWPPRLPRCGRRLRGSVVAYGRDVGRVAVFPCVLWTLLAIWTLHSD